MLPPLKRQQDIQVRFNDGRITAVAGQWLHGELSSRRNDPHTGKRVRATSVPGFCCNEGNSNHPSVALVQPILRRATPDEEEQQYTIRVLREVAKLVPQFVPHVQALGIKLN